MNIKLALALIIVSTASLYGTENILKDQDFQELEKVEFIVDGGSVRFQFISKAKKYIYLLAKNRIFQDEDSNQSQKIYFSLTDNFKNSREILEGSDDEKKILKELKICRVSTEKMKGDMLLLSELISDRKRPWPRTSEWSFYDKEKIEKHLRELGMEDMIKNYSK